MHSKNTWKEILRKKMKKSRKRGKNLYRKGLKADKPELSLQASGQVQEIGCLLCNAPPAFLGVFSPVQRLVKELGEPPDKFLGFAYSLCNKCAELEEKFRLVEEKIIHESLTRKKSLL